MHLRLFHTAMPSKQPEEDQVAAAVVLVEEAESFLLKQQAAWGLRQSQRLCWIRPNYCRDRCPLGHVVCVSTFVCLALLSVQRA